MKEEDKITENTVENTTKEGNRTGKQLTPFKSGEEWKGNAKGRPKGSRNLTMLFKESFEEIKERSKNKGVIITDPEIEIMMSLLGQAQKGNVRAMELFMKYKYGNPTQPIDISGEIDVKTDNIMSMVELFKNLTINEEK